MNNFKKFLAALKENRDGVRKKTAIAVGTTAAAFVAAIVLTKLEGDRVDVLVLEESRPEEPILEEYTNPTEF